MKKFLAILGAAFFLLSSAHTQQLSSPDGSLQLTFTLLDSVPYYQLNFKGKAIIKKSKLGLELVKDHSFTNGFVLSEHKMNALAEKWKPILGEVKEIESVCAELIISLYQPKQDRKINIRFRLFNDGLGFRYEFPQQKNLNYFVIKEEKTEIGLTEDYTAWWIPSDYDTQEYNYTTSSLSAIPSLFDKSYDANSSQTIVPLSVQTPLQLRSSDKKVYINIHEAALVGYPAYSLSVDPLTYTFTSHLTPDAQGNKGYIQTPFHTPWRTVIVADNAPAMLSSKLILNLNEPTTYPTTDWIKPVKYVGVWWEMIFGRKSWNYTNLDNIHLGKTDYKTTPANTTHGATNTYVKKHIDFAAKHGFDGVLVEGWNEGWEDWYGKSKEFVFDFVTPYPDFDLKMLNEYAHSKGVKLIMHHETSSSATNYERHFDTAFALMNQYGYTAVKTGYVGDIIPRGEHHYSQWMVEHYQRVVDKAAKHKIMVNSHESVHPTGLHRTYPNWIAAEAARGTEYEAFGGNNAEHQTILPFTRFIGGPMDYTPGIFQTQLNYYNPNDTRFVKTTLTKQLALYVVMYSPLQMAADVIDNYERFPEPFQFIKDVALDWDDTKILAAEPGDYILTARKAKGKEDWFVGGITDENARTLTIDFSFLDPGVRYEATIYEDGKGAHYITNPQAYHIYKKKITSKTKLKQQLAASGGVAISIRKL